MKKAQWFNSLGAFALAASCVAAGPAWSDEPASASLKADVEVLKQRLTELEGKLAQQDAVSKGAEPGKGIVQLPSGLQGIQMSGYVDASYIYNFDSPAPPTTANGARVFDRQSNGFTPQAAELVFEKPLSDASPVGFRTDLFFGDDAEVIHSTGLGNGGTPSDSFDLQQAYVSARVPVGSGLDVKVGKFVTLLGAEVIESPMNWNFSRSLLFGFAIPFTHTGVVASYPLGEWGSTSFGLVNGWDIVDDNNKGKTILGNITLTSIKDLTLGFNLITGPERASDNRNDRTVFDAVATWVTPVQGLTLMANYDYGHESGLAHGTASTKGFDTANWSGIALYAKYDVSPTWSLASRWEWFNDADNVRTQLTSLGGSTPDDLHFTEYTLTSQWTLHKNLLARLEYRQDKASERVFTRQKGLSSNQGTVASELIYQF